MIAVVNLTTMAMFAGLVVMFLRRSLDGKDWTVAGEQPDSLVDYIAASIGLACASWINARGSVFLATLVLALVCIYVALALRPFARRR
jgi:hypothetical protein